MNKIEKLLTIGVEEVIVKEHLEKSLLSGDKLRIKFGIDPTGSELHLGHSVALRKLKEFQDLGHKIIFLIGDFTAMIGDPSGKSETRKVLTKKEVKNNMKNYKSQAGKILNIKKTDIKYNSKWYDRLGAQFIFEIASKFTVARVLERDDFKKRIEDDVDVSMLEIFYPLFQGYDSVELESDLEIGGTDQKFNLLMGRKVQRRYGKKEQDIMTIPLLKGLDGVKKMSKSLNNQIGITEKPNDMYSKIMSIPDTLIPEYYLLLTDLDYDKNKNPRDAKMKLAFEIVKIYHNEKEAKNAQENFVKLFQKKEIPDNIQEIKTKKGNEIADVLIENKIVLSKTDFRRLIHENAIDVNEKTISDVHFKIEKESVVKVGKKKFVKITI